MTFVPFEFKICNRITVRTWRKNKLKILSNIANVIRIQKTKSSFNRFHSRSSVCDKIDSLATNVNAENVHAQVEYRKLSTFLLIFTLDKTKIANLAKLKAPSDVLEC